MPTPDALSRAGAPPEPSRPDQSALRRVVRLAARSLHADAAQYIAAATSTDITFGEAASLRGFGLKALVTGGQGLYIPDTVGTPPFSRLAPAVRFFAAVPVLGQGGKRHGVLCVLGAEPRDFDAEAQQVLAEFGFLLAAAIDGERTAAAVRSERGGLFLLVDPQTGEVVTANDAWRAFSGADMARGGSTLADHGIVAPDRVLAALQRALSGERDMLRLRCRTPDGAVRIAEFTTATDLADGRLLIRAGGRDVTEEVRAAERLRRRERTLHGLYNAAAAMMGVLELDGEAFRIVECNEATAQFFGHVPETLSGSPSGELGMPAPIEEQWVEALQACAVQGNAVRFTYDHPHARGRRRLVADVWCLGPAAEGAPQFAYHVEDVTERAEAEAAAAAVRARAESGARLHEGLVASLAREIRTPLDTLVGFAEALDEAVAAEHRDLAGLVVRGGQRLLGTVDSVLALAQPDERPAFGPVDAVAEAEAVAALLRPIAERKGLTLAVEADAVPAVRADAGLLGRVLHTLVADAISFTMAGGVRVVLADAEGTVEVRVEDTSESVNEAFLPSRPASAALPAERFALTERLAEHLGGTLRVTSGRRAGTTVVLRLPVMGPIDEADEHPADEHPAPEIAWAELLHDD